MTVLRTAKPVPAWLNIDALDVTNDDIDKIEALTRDLREFLPTAIRFSERIVETKSTRSSCWTATTDTER